MDPGHRPAQSAACRAAACNAHDVDAWPARVHEEAVSTSACDRQLLPETGRVRRGKAAIRACWTTGLARIPTYASKADAVSAGVDARGIACTCKALE